MKPLRTRYETLALALLCGLFSACTDRQLAEIAEIIMPQPEESDEDGLPPPPPLPSPDVVMQGPALYADVNRNGICDLGDTITVPFSGSVRLFSGVTGASVDDLFTLHSDPGSSGLGNDFFGEAPSFYIGDDEEDTIGDTVTIVLGFEPYLKCRQIHGQGLDALYPTGIDLTQNPSSFLRIYPTSTSNPISLVVRGAAPQDIAPTMVLGMAALAATYVRSIAMFDLDGDGDQDLACGLSFNQLAGDVVFLLNDGLNPPGFVLAGQTLSLGVAPGSSGGVDTLKCADFDGDGDLDVLALSVARGSDPLWLNNGDGSFSPAAAGPLTDIRGDDCVLGDLDLDGDLDLAVCSGQDDTVSLFENTGPGLFSAGPELLSAEAVRTLALTDFNGDGRLDMLTGGPFAGSNRIWINDGGAAFLGFGSAPGASYLDSPVDGLLVADVDQDGALDFVASSEDAGEGTRIIYNDGQGAVRSIVSLGQADPASDGRAVALADFDGDGLMDLARTGCSQTELEVLSGIDDGPLATFTHALGGRFVISGDLDSDGDLDLVVARCGGGLEIVCNSLGGVQGVLALREPQQGLSGNTRDVHLEDIDGDGDLDVICNGDEPVYLNDGSGTFTPSPQPINMQNVSDLAIGDLDGDSDLDLVLARDTGSPLAVGVSFHLNDGGMFSGSGDDLNLQHIAQVGLGDVNGDGSLDLYCNSFASAFERIYINDGSGSFSFLAQITQGAVITEARFADMDGDGDLDLVRSVQNSGVSLLLNDGSGGFTPGGTLGMNSGFLCTADVDSDGDQDVITTDGPALRILFNQGDGILNPAAATFGSSWVNRITAVDIDADGDMDLAVGSNSNDEPLWLNDGQGGFSAAFVDLPGLCYDVGYGDIDSDGDDDLVLSTLYLGGAYLVRIE
jgi:hypothetical protein